MQHKNTQHKKETRSHNPEVVGSSPASATIKSPEIVRFQDFSCVLGIEKFEEKFYEFEENRLTHVLTHNRIALSGQVRIFQNTMSTKSEKTEKFQNFSKEFFYDLRVFHSMFKTSPSADHQHRERVFVYGVPTIELSKNDLYIEYGVQS